MRGRSQNHCNFHSTPESGAWKSVLQNCGKTVTTYITYISTVIKNHSRPFANTHSFNDITSLNNTLLFLSFK
jgi:hypothetical protein